MKHDPAVAMSRRIAGGEPRAPLTRRQLLSFARTPPAPEAGHWIRVHRAAMACRFEVVLPGEAPDGIAAARAALDEADRLEARLSVFRETSELTRVNRLAAREDVPIDRGLFDLLALCARIHADTGGAFDITSTPLSRCWGFLRREGRVPDAQEIAAARETVGMRHVTLDEGARTVRIRRDGVELNLGAIGKGYALDRMGEGVAALGVRDALLSAGGSSVLAVGDGSRRWRIDLRSTQAARDPLARVFLRRGALATSGAGEQYVDANGTRYGHVIDPRTGWPASGLLSVTVIARTAALADALSTAFLVGGAELARGYCASRRETRAILVRDDETRSAVVIGRHAGSDVEVL